MYETWLLSPAGSIVDRGKHPLTRWPSLPLAVHDPSLVDDSVKVPGWHMMYRLSTAMARVAVHASAAVHQPLTKSLPILAVDDVKSASGTVANVSVMDRMTCEMMSCGKRCYSVVFQRANARCNVRG